VTGVVTSVLAFQVPVGGIIVSVLGGLGYFVLLPFAAKRLPGAPARPRPSVLVTPRQRALFLTGLVVLALLESWPILQLAREVSSFAYLTHNLLIGLVAVPLMLLGIPDWLLHQLTESEFVDALLTMLTQPVIATIIYCGVLMVSMLSAIVDAQARSLVVFVYLQVLFVFAGAVMWIPALRLLPGAHKMSTGARVLFLFAQSLLPSFPAIVLIFAHHPFYSVFVHNVHTVFGISEVGDQELAGGISKVIDFGILWGVAVAIMSRAQKREDAGFDPEPITWLDVEREFKRSRPAR
jgi:putative membrane protein